MSESGLQGRKRKRSESTEPESPQSPNTSLPALSRSPPFQEPPSTEEQPFPPTIPELQQPQAPSASTAPLTRANLRLHDSTMPPKTPKSKSDTASTTTSRATNDKWRETRELNEAHNMVIDNSATREKFKDFLDEVRDIVGAERQSVMKATSIKRFKEQLERSTVEKERGFIDRLWRNMLMKDSRTVNQGEETGQIVRYEEHHMAQVEDQLLNRAALPGVDSATIVKALVDRSHELIQPKADITIGFYKDAFCKDQLEVIRLPTYKIYAELTTNIKGAFFVIEWKGSDGFFEVGINQATTAGAACVSATRQLNVMAELTDPKALGPDKRSIAFSMVIAPRISQINVHWAEVTKEEVIYHSSKLTSYINDEDEGQMRRAINNICDWGCFTHNKRYFKPALDAIVQQFRQKAAMTGSEEANSVGSGEKGKGKKRERDDLDELAGE